MSFGASNDNGSRLGVGELDTLCSTLFCLVGLYGPTTTLVDQAACTAVQTLLNKPSGWSKVAASKAAWKAGLSPVWAYLVEVIMLVWNQYNVEAEASARQCLLALANASDEVVEDTTFQLLMEQLGLSQLEPALLAAA